MSKEDAYFQFPLYALTFQESVKARCEFIIAYSTVEAGLTLWENLTDLAREEKIGSLEDMEDLPEDTEWDCEKHLAVIVAYRIIGLKGGSMIQMLEKHAQVEQYLSAYEMRNKEDAIVRIKRDLLFDVLHGTGMNYREFAVLCAIHSVIGDKGKPVRITLGTIQRRAFGYKSAAALKSDSSSSFAVHTPEAKMLTIKQVRGTLDELHRRSWFARLTYGNRQTYYSTRMSEDELKKRIIAMKTRAFRFKAERARKNQDLTTEVKAEQLKILSASKMASST